MGRLERPAHDLDDWHRLTVGAVVWRGIVPEGRIEQSVAASLGVFSFMREARLRPEFADLYPTLTPGQWEPAARVAEAVLARLLLLESSEGPIQDRVLLEEHFEFRGESPDGAPRAPGSARTADRIRE